MPLTPAKLKRNLGKKHCGAKRKYDGQPCQARPMLNGRCYLHGGMSKGPTSPEGKARALANLMHSAKRQANLTTRVRNPDAESVPQASVPATDPCAQPASTHEVPIECARQPGDDPERE